MRRFWDLEDDSDDDLEEYATQTDLDFEKVMNDDSVEWTTTTKTFIFGTGQLLNLQSKQIDQLPYLLALVSAADNFSSTFNEHGHYVLNRRIKIGHLCFIISSLSFRSDQQLLTRLPKRDNAMAVLALYDFLGMTPKTVPTLDKVNQTLFLREYSCCPSFDSPDIRKRIHIRDTVVQFVIALAKEEYDPTDLTKHQIYRFIAYILINDTLFGPRLRHHTLTIYQYCCYSLSRNEQEQVHWELPYTIDHIRKMQSSINYEDFASDGESELPRETKRRHGSKFFRPSSYHYCCLTPVWLDDCLMAQLGWPMSESEINRRLERSEKEIRELRNILSSSRRSEKHGFPKQNIAQFYSIPKHAQMPKSQAKLMRR